MTLVGLALMLTACQAPRENSFHRAARERHASRHEMLRERQIQQRRQLELTYLADEQELRELRDQAARRAQTLRMADRALAREQRALDEKLIGLAGVREQARTLRLELEGVRRLEAEIELKELRLRALAKQRQDLEALVQGAQAAFEKAQAEMMPQLQKLQQQILTVRETDEAVKRALEVLEAAGVPAVPAGAKPAGAAAATPPGSPNK